MELNCSYTFYYDINGSYIKGILNKETPEYYILQNAEKYIAGTGHSTKIESTNNKCTIIKSNILYLTKN